MSTGPFPDHGGALQLLSKGALPALALLFVLGLGLTYVQLSRNHEILIERTAVQHAAVYSDTLDKFRELYASEVVETARKSNLRVTHDYLTEPNAIPLPITLSRKFEEDTPTGVTTRMYSPFPFEFPGVPVTGGLKDEFGRDAWQALNSGPEEAFYRIEDFKGVRSLRYATAERMKSQCVTCHNTYAGSPKTDWEVGDVRGVLEVDYPLDQAAALAEGSIWEMLGTLTPMLLLALLLLGLTTRNHRRHADALEKRILAQQQAQRAAAENADLRTKFARQGTELLESRVELLGNEERLDQVLESIPLGILKIDPEGLTRYANTSALQLLGDTGVFGPWTDAEATESAWYWGGTDDPCPLAELPSMTALRGHSASAMNLEFRRDGRSIPLLVSAAPIFDLAGEVTFAIVAVQDVSDEKQLEQQVRQAQRMHAVARLAGGVAHDFNNELTTIINFTTYAMERIDRDSAAAGDLQQVMKAAGRGATLTRELLAFSRQQSVNPLVIELNPAVNSIAQMLDRLPDTGIEFVTELDANVPNVRLAAGALERVLMNLAVNAQDAMPRGGALRISTSTVVLDDATARRQGMDIAAGEYVCIAMADNGMGMDDATRRHMFDPFYTTKGPGKGTGLGLSTCWGIVRQAGGHIAVESALGRGTSVHVYLPAVHEKPSEAPTVVLAPANRPDAMVLVAEDDERVRSVAVRSLKDAGYRVIEAADGAEALDILNLMPAGSVDLLLTDVRMPGLSGPELVRAISSKHQEMPVLYMSAYNEEMILDHGSHQTRVELLQKPFTPETLTQRVWEVLQSEVQPSVEA